MPGRATCLQLFILFVGLSLVLSGARGLPAAEAVIVVYPGVVKSIPGPEKPKTSRRRRNPRVGTRKQESRLTGVRIEPARASGKTGGRSKSGRGGDDEDKDRPEDDDSIEVEKKGNAFEILARESAAGRLYKLTAHLTIRTQQFKRFSRDEFGKKIQPYTSWVDLPDREETQQFTVAVALGSLPEALVPAGEHITISFSKALRRLTVRRKSRSEAEVEADSENRLRILGKKAGDAKFDLRYELAGKKLAASLPVRVLKKANVVRITVERDRKGRISIDDMDALFHLRGGRVLRVDAIGDPAVAEVAFDEYRVQVKGLQVGTTRALLAYTGLEYVKNRKPLRCQTQVALEITVKE